MVHVIIIQQLKVHYCHRPLNCKLKQTWLLSRHFMPLIKTCIIAQSFLLCRCLLKFFRLLAGLYSGCFSGYLASLKFGSITAIFIRLFNLQPLKFDSVLFPRVYKKGFYFLNTKNIVASARFVNSLIFFSHIHYIQQFTLDPFTDNWVRVISGYF